MESSILTLNNTTPIVSGPLDGITVLDLSRVLAAPSCTQILGDLGAKVIKVERPGTGDEIRNWGPPFVKDEDGVERTTESAYFLSTNRNKSSVTIDFSKPEGATLIKDLMAKSDIVVENFKVGNLAKYGLAYDDVKSSYPALIYCSVTGYGQNGPYAHRPGYDMVAQCMGGLISMTGEAGRLPAKVPLAVNDIISGLYATVAILGALHHRNNSGMGQYIDVALLDTQVAWLYNQGLNYLLDGRLPERLGTAHPNIVPYQVFEAADGFILLGAVNDTQFARFCQTVEREDLLEDARFATNPERVRNRVVVIEEIATIIRGKPVSAWAEILEQANLTFSPVNQMDQVFADPQVIARGMKIEMPYSVAGNGTLDLIASPIRLSETPVSYRSPPPTLGQHTDEILESVLGLTSKERAALKAKDII